MLQGSPKRLKHLIDEWAAGDFRNIPEIVLLPNGDISGAMGAYAISTRKIYLNQDWLLGASAAQIISVLTEELGHHLDGMLNDTDTPGDEGQDFSILLGGRGIERGQGEGLVIQADSATVKDGKRTVPVEQALASPAGGGFLTLAGTSYNSPWEYVHVKDSPSLSVTGEYTVSCWIYRLNAGGDWRNLYDIPDAHLLEFSPEGGFDWRAENNNTDFNANGNAITEGQWHHIAATMTQTPSGFAADVYIDGIIANTGTSWQLGPQANATGVRDSNSDLYIGILWSQRNGNPDPWAGSIDDFKIWNTALTASEIQSTANRTGDV